MKRRDVKYGGADDIHRYLCVGFIYAWYWGRYSQIVEGVVKSSFVSLPCGQYLILLELRNVPFCFVIRLQKPEFPISELSCHCSYSDLNICQSQTLNLVSKQYLWSYENKHKVETVRIIIYHPILSIISLWEIILFRDINEKLLKVQSIKSINT